MKKYFLFSLAFGFWLLAFSSSQVFALEWLWKKTPIITQDQEKTLSRSLLDRIKSNPVRRWMYEQTKNPEEWTVANVINHEQIETHGRALQETLRLIQIIINRSLGILGLVALIYLVYNGFMMLTAHGDEKQFDKGKSWIKTATIAIAGIGISRFIVSMILRLIFQLTKTS